MPVPLRAVLASTAALLLSCGPASWAEGKVDLLSPPRLLAQARYGAETDLDRPAAPSPAREASSREVRGSDALLGLGVIAVPGGPFLLWTDPELESPVIRPIPGVVLFMVSAAFGIKAYVGGNIGQGVGIHLGAMAVGFGGYYYAQPGGSLREASAPSSPGAAFTARF